MKGKSKRVSLSREEVLHVAGLSNLDLSEKEVGQFKEQLSEVLDYVAQLAEVDTEGVEPTSQTTGMTNRMREDEVREGSLNQEEAISGGKKSHNGMFVVPGILDKGG